MFEDLVTIEDLDQLETADLRAVIAQVEMSRVATALTGLDPALRRRLVSRLPQSDLEALTGLQKDPARGPLSAESVLNARQEIVETLCRLARHGQIAFDHPEDILDMVA